MSQGSRSTPARWCLGLREPARAYQHLKFNSFIMENFKNVQKSRGPDSDSLIPTPWRHHQQCFAILFYHLLAGSLSCFFPFMAGVFESQL